MVAAERFRVQMQIAPNMKGNPGYIGLTEKQMQKKLDNEMETGMIKGLRCQDPPGTCNPKGPST